MRTAADVPGQTIRTVTPGTKDRNAIDPVQLQQTLLRFSDDFFLCTTLRVDNLRRGTNALDPAEILQWKILLGTETCSIASGPNAVANVLDMAVFVAVMRAAVESYWQPKVFGESAQLLFDACQNSETQIWRIASTVLKPEQQAELRKAIEEWRRQNPHSGEMLASRPLGFAAEVARANQASTAQPGSVFSLRMLDPLSGLDPATREIAQTRLFAERALYVAQKMPMLLRWQTELLTIKTVDLPVVRQLVTNSTELTASVERFARVAEQLPQRLSTEREEILKALRSQEKNLTPLVNEVRQTLTSGSQMSTSLNTTLTTFDALMKRFGVGETNQAGPPDTNSQPFRIQDYGQTAVQVEAMARQLTDLVKMLDETLASTNVAKLATQVAPAVQQAQAGGKEIVDYAFWKSILLVAIVLAAALIYRLVAGRLAPKTSSKVDPL